MYTGTQGGYDGLNFRYSYYGNGSPIFYGGYATMDTAAGQLNVPNMWAQQAAYTQQWNRGTANIVRDTINTVGYKNPNMPYSSISAIQGQIDSIMNKYDWMKRETAVDPMQYAKDRYQAALQKYNDIKSSRINQVGTEYAIAGQNNVFNNSLDSALLSAERELQSVQVPEDRYFRNKSQDESIYRTMTAAQEFSKINWKPTTSNLPIREIYIG